MTVRLGESIVLAAFLVPGVGLMRGFRAHSRTADQVPALVPEVPSTPTTDRDEPWCAGDHIMPVIARPPARCISASGGIPEPRCPSHTSGHQGSAWEGEGAMRRVPDRTST